MISAKATGSGTEAEQGSADFNSGRGIQEASPFICISPR